MRVALGALVVLAVLAGCSGPAAPSATEDEPVEQAEAVEDPWGGAESLLIVDWHADTIETDIPLCLGGGSGFDLERTGNPIPADATQLKFTLATAETQTGVQVGYSIDGADFVWSPPVHGGPASFLLEITPDQTEPTVDWDFRHQMNLPEPAAQECYTGGGSGQWDIVVEALKA